MSTPTGGSWNNDQQGQGEGQWGQGAPRGYQGQSLGQDYGQQQGQSQQQDYSQQQGQTQQQDYSQPQPGQQAPGQHAPQGYGQPGEQPQQADQGGQHGGFAGHAQQVGQQFGADAGQVVAGAGEGVGDLFSDLQFKKSLTEKIASLTFLGVIIWAVLNFISKLTYNFGSSHFGGDGANGFDVKNMGTFAGIMHTISDLVWLIVIVAIVRLALELAINVARIAQRSKS